jgi:hypothetical protein
MPTSEIPTERAKDKAHAVAFRDLKICDIDRCSELAASLAAHCSCDGAGELAVLVVQRLSVELGDFKRDC